MKKSVRFLIFSIIPIILLTSLVMAIQPAPAMPATNLPANPFQGISDLLTGLLKTVGDIFGMAVGSTPFGLGEDIFAKMILFIIITMILYVPSEKLSGNKPWIAWIVSIGVSLLGVRFIDSSIVNAILLPYGVLTIALSTMIPLILYGFFIYNENLPSFVRKTGWWFFVACFLALYIWRAPTITDSTASLMYLLSGGLAVCAAIIDKKLYTKIEETKIAAATANQDISAVQAEVDKMKTEKEGLLDRFRRLDPNQKIADRMQENGIWKQVNNISEKISRFEKALAQVKANK